MRPQVLYLPKQGDMEYLSSILLFLCIMSSTFALKESTPTPSCSDTSLDDNLIHSHHLNSSSVHLRLHHIRSPCSPLEGPRPSASQVLDRDIDRAKTLLSRLSTVPSHNPARLDSSHLADSKTGVPLGPGDSYGVGNFIASISLGTPSYRYVVIMDTGSSLSWVQCQPCKLSCYPQQGPIFNPSTSRSYSAVGCSTTACRALTVATLNPPLCSVSKVCIYEASYGDGSFSIGYLSSDTLQLGAGATLPGFIFGCGQDNEGLFGKAAGLIGLARDRLSMLSQLAPKYGNAFTYCLPTASGSSGYLSLGAYSTTGLTFTPMLSSSSDNSLYYLKLTAIYVAGKPIPVSGATYASTPTIIDSGTVITRLPSTIYTALSRAVAKALASYPRAPAYSILDTCFKGSYSRLAVPKVSLVFTGGAGLTLSPHNVFYDLNSVGITCLAFAPSSQTAIIGNRQQQTFRVVYDVASAKIGFGEGGCS